MTAPRPAPEHEFEAAHGLPELLPPGENILWQGSPDWRALAVKIMHLRALSIYFAAMLLWRGGTVLSESGSGLIALQSIVLPGVLAAAALGLLGTFAWLTSKTTVYTMTNRRVVMRIGIVLSVTFNLPYRMIESASLRPDANGSGDIALQLAASDKIAYLNLWPHARPWKVKRPEPMLRAVPEVAKVGQLLANAIVDAAPVGGATVNPLPPAPQAHVGTESAPSTAQDHNRPHGSPVAA